MRRQDRRTTTSLGVSLATGSVLLGKIGAKLKCDGFPGMAQGDFWDLLDAVENCDSAEVDFRFTRYLVQSTSGDVEWSDVQPGKNATPRRAAKPGLD
jgi:hypothetical protein